MSEANETFSMQADTAVDGNGSSRVVHFDATQKRRQRMRQHAEGENGKSAAPKAAPAKPASNGAGTAGQANSGIPAPASAKPVAAPVTAFKPPAPVATAPAAAPKPVAPAPAPQSAPAKAGTPTTSPAKTLDPQELEKFLIKFVVEQTGYPEEMVELDADLEADLGIDSIKKAQLFAEMGEHLDVQVEINENMSLDDFPTLRHVKDFLQKQPVGEKGQGASLSPSSQALVQAATNAAPASTAGQASSGTPAVQAAPKVQAAPAVHAGNGAAQAARPVQTFAPAKAVTPIAPAKAGTPTNTGATTPGWVSPDPNVKRPQLTAPMTFPATAARTAAPATPAKENAPAKAATPTGSAPAKTLDPRELEKFLISFVVEQTGYPEEMVELDADLEADLGIDSIKKAQLFAEMGEHLDVQVEINENMSLDDFPTLRHVMEFLAKQPVGAKGQGATLAPQSQAIVQQAAASASTAGQASSGTPVVQAAPVAHAGNGVASHVARPVQTFAPPKAATPVAPATVVRPVTAVKPVAAAVAPQIGPAKAGTPAGAVAKPAAAFPSPAAVAARPATNAAMSFPAAAKPAPTNGAANTNGSAAASGPALSSADLEKFLISFVVEQTGYPEEMVELDADLEADLGIDSIKKAQLFAEMGEHLDVQVEISEDMSLDDFPTLRHVMEFLMKQPSGAKAKAAGG